MDDRPSVRNPPDFQPQGRGASSARATGGEKYQRLCDFFRGSFNPGELDIFLRLKGFAAVAEAVNKNVAGATYFFEVVQALDRRGSIDAAFFDHLTKERPAKATQIEVSRSSGSILVPGVFLSMPEIPRSGGEMVPLFAAAQASITASLVVLAWYERAGDTALTWLERVVLLAANRAVSGFISLGSVALGQARLSLGSIRTAAGRTPARSTRRGTALEEIPQPTPTSPAIRTKFSVMMFLEHTIWGAWLPLLGVYIGRNSLNFTPMQQSWVFSAYAIGSITGLFFGGPLADCYFAQ
jgi:hypothetical protein